MADADIWPWIGMFEELAAEVQNEVARLVLEGGALNATEEQIHNRLSKASRLALLRDRSTGRIAGVAGLKRPDRHYRARKFADAGVSLSGFENAPELGYVVVAEAMRGQQLSGHLVELIAQDLRTPAFATTDSATMKNNLERSGFGQVAVFGNYQRRPLRSTDRGLTFEAIAV